MDQEHINETMLKAAQESIESLAFAEVFAYDEVYKAGDKDLEIRMEIISPAQGTFTMHASREMLEEIAQSLFPATEEFTDAQINDLASELLNTIGGNFLNKILPESTSFTLGLPEVSSPTKDDDTDNLLQWSFTLEEIPFSLYLKGEIITTL